MNSGSTSNSQFPGFSSQAPINPEQLAFLQTQQQAFFDFQQSQQQNLQQFSIPQQQSQSSNSLSQTEAQPKRVPRKRSAKKSKDVEVPDEGVSFRWQPDKETLLAKCYVAVSEDRNVGRSHAKDTFWYRVLNEFNRLNFQKRTKDMLSSKWNTLNHNCQNFNAIYKRCSRLTKSGESELDVMKQARGAYRDENKNITFAQEDAWEILRKHAKWDAPAPVDLTENEEIAEVNTDELFGPDARPRPPGKQCPGKKTKSDTSVSTGGSSSSSQFGDIMPKELRLKREAAEAAFEVAKEKDRMVMRLEEMKFLAISTKDLSEDDAYFIEEQKKTIRAKYNLYRN
ncbi:hypothetical protein Tco_0726271 [Tanacetum coccineum]|uniref:No apical meristem-associated C-terminal domain-containing protein n=1 Tax=Tanacetum coccineum TaxID=301880 RepID=A0ABQ4YHE7_9ASTR